MSNFTLIASLKSLRLETATTELKKTCQHVGNSLINKSMELQDALQILSEYVLNFEDAKLFRRYLSNILLALVSSKIPLKPVFAKSEFQQCCDSEKWSHLEYSIVLALLSDHPDVMQYALKYFEINPIPLYEVFIHHNEAYNVAPKKRRLQDSRQKITDHHIVKCCYTLLSKLPNELSMKWDWSNFVAGFSNHKDSEIRWMVKESMVILTNMTEAQAKRLTINMNLSNKDCLQSSIMKTTNKISIQSVEESIGDVNLSKTSVVNIDGIMLPIYNKENVLCDSLVSVKSAINNLRSLALAVASGKALCLMGPVGSGKTSLVEHLAAITGRKGVAFKKIQLGDQTDSRMLLGSHQCTDIPGEFVWRPGVLTEAVQNGHWLLLEDIDCAALDVASTLSSLLERNTLSVPGYRDTLPVTPGFQLFVTQRTLITNYGFQKKLSSSSTLLQKHLTQINVEPLSRSELAEVIQTLYPSLTTICPRMIEVFMMFSVGSHDTSLQATEGPISEKESKNLTIIRGSRLISTRDLMKWCARSVVGFDVTSPEAALKVLQDALDIFTCSVSSPEHRLELAKKVGLSLGIVENKSEFYCKHYKPNVSLNLTSLDVGRAKVKRKEKSLEAIDFDNKQAVFSFTRQSASLLERIACCVTFNEPVLLVGETGTGKTSSVQYLARQTGHKLIVINMNQQSDSADLLGGYKPVDLKYVIKPILYEFEEMFKDFYNIEKNKKFLNHINSCFKTENWVALLALMKQSYKSAISRLQIEKKDKKLKVWLAFGMKLEKLEQQIKAASRLTFAFIEGSLVKAMQKGYWVLLDEINLASAEILECLAGLLEDKNETIELLEKGDKVPIKRHPEFTLFACMNPATDVGKKDLPVGLRNRFTEFFIDELTERNDLMLLIGDYLYHMNLSGAILEAIFLFYSTIRKEAKLNLIDGSGNAPHYSLRTLCRALTAAAKAKCGTVSRSLYEAFCLSFLTQLDSSSHPKVEAMIAKAVIGKKNIKSVINQLIPEPQIQGQNFLLFEGHWIPQGTLDIAIPEGYILTPTVRKNLRDIARIISLGKLPVLLQGDTSVGKTSLITYIAKASGNYCVRINNHEHTDLQEYIGSYSADANGKLVFKEGVLVEAMRKGYWIILDELNLAPSDVLEALNRVLDDNRELFIPETQQVVKADPNFMLFATQNPPGLYGGRKMLSRAFRNRFVELHFDEIPRNELEIILHQRCHIPPTYSKKMIAVMADLQVRRRGSAAVQGKDGFITLRDLFRWGQRYKLASKDILTEDKFYDWDQHIADEGYLVLAGKVRQPDERNIIEEVIEKQIKRKVSPDNLFSLHAVTSPVTKPILELLLNNQLEEFSHVVWTYNMRRLAILIAKSFSFDEPVLLVGETGCGKTTICQVLASLKKSQLLSVNCHMHTESSDFLGGLRPVRQYNNDGRLFEWVDGPLIKAMKSGNMFLADEISLADDSVLERLNSLLEPEKQLVLAERGMDSSDIIVITAAHNFHFIGTMNPGGDFGKKELSPALRNRFTEIWCDSVTSKEDLLAVLEKSVSKGISLGNQEDGSSGIGNSILVFTDWLKTSEVTNKFPFSIRDLLTWVNFVNITVNKGLLDTPEAYVHGACMTFLDCFGTAITGHIEIETLHLLRKNAIDFLINQIKTVGNEYLDSLSQMLSNKRGILVAETNATCFGIKPFYIETGLNLLEQKEDTKFTFTAPTTGANTLRLLRGLQLNKAILLEGNPGVGKTSLVTALAKASGHKVVRINLSDQTDITDLFGTDLPSEDGSFTFKEGAFLSALQNGDWVLLDELNLAPQPVLEGLNACLDHRGEVFIPELGKTFKVKKETNLFACQNPLKQGGARRGLPISFLNRFTQVYIDTLTDEDLKFIVESQYPSLPKDILHRIVNFNCKVGHEITVLQSWAHKGGPWEMNLRDIQRWCEALIEDQKSGQKVSPGKFVEMLYINRMRTVEDKQKMIDAYDEIFNPEYPRSDSSPQFDINHKIIVIGDVTIQRNEEKLFKNRRAIETNMLILRNQLPVLKALTQSVNMNWLSILVGPSATGKSSIVQVLADLTGNDLQIVPVTSAMDVSDLLGGFEQVDYNRNLENVYDKIETLTIETVRNLWLAQKCENWKTNKLLSHLYQYKSLQSSFTNNNYSNNEIKKFYDKIDLLLRHCENLLEYNKHMHMIHDKAKEIIKKLTLLKAKVAKTSSVNAGGKFEWIDSLLVKTMIGGSWLLLDNVNLTSAAVLDRLNGLLEPNGVLSIPERGEINELTPHPNFRVFFTMDPKYGEISRAMRNRGVEIYILRPDDFDTNLSETIPYMDLIALLSSSGLSKKYHDLCIGCHELMSSFIRGLEKPTISHLLQAAHLTCQQIIRGIPSDTALINSFSDVYIKPRCGGDFSSTVNMSLAEMKNSMLTSLQVALKKENKDILNSKELHHTLTVKGLSVDSSYEMVLQNSCVAIQHFGSGSEFKLHCLSSLFAAYQRCPDESLDILFTLVNQSYTQKHSNKLETLCRQLNEVAYNSLCNLNGNSESKRRFYPESNQLEIRQINISNAKAAILYYDLWKEFTNMEFPGGQFSALDYSKAVLSGDLTDDFVEYPILKYSQYYLQTIDRLIEDVIKAKESTLCDKKICKIIQMFNWRYRFVKICSAPIFVTSKKKRTPILKEEIIPLLYIHSKWLQKYLLGELRKSLPNNINLFDSFNKTLKEIMIQDQCSSILTKLSKKVRKLYGQPKLYESSDEYNNCIDRVKVYNALTLDLTQPIERQLQKLALYGEDICVPHFGFDVPEQIDLIHLESSLEKVERSDIKVGLEQRLLPINSYVIQRVLHLLQTYFLDALSKLNAKINNTSEMTLRSAMILNIESQESLLNLVNLAKVTKGFPPKLLQFLNIILTLENGVLVGYNESLSSLSFKFWDEFYKQLTVSPSHYPLAFLDLNSKAKSEDELELPINTKRLPSDLPLLLYYVQKFTVSAGNEGARHSLAYETVSLRDRAEYSVQLGTVLNVVWKNIASLDTAASVNIKSDALFEMNKYEQLMLYLNSVIIPSDKVKTFNTELMEETTSALHKLLENDDNTFSNMITSANNAYVALSVLVDEPHNKETILFKIATSSLSLLTSLLSIRIMADVSAVDHVEKNRLKVEYIEEDVQIFETLLSAYYVCGLISGTITGSDSLVKASDITPDCYKDKTTKDILKKVHPYCSVIMDLKEKTAEKIHKYASGNTFRPKEPSYGSFVKDCRHFTNSVLSSSTVTDVSKNLISTVNILNQVIVKNILAVKPEIQQAQTVFKQTASWLYSINAFYNRIETNYSEAFPDLAKPLQSSLSQISFSVTRMNDLIKELLVKIEQGPILQNSVKHLMVYPNAIPKSHEREEHLKRFVMQEFLQLLRKNVLAANSEDTSTFIADLECLEVLKMNLTELKMYCYAMEKVDHTSFEVVKTTLNSMVKTWEKQQRDIEKKKQDEDALYVTKSKCEDEDEEAEAIQEILEMFPSHADNDFAEFKPPTLDQKKSNTNQTAENQNKIRPLITADDVTLVYNWHSSFIRNMTATEWLPAPKKLPGFDATSALIQRYPIFSRLIQNGWEALDAELEGILSPTLMVFISEIKAKIDGDESTNHKVDFYWSPWVSETRQCVPLLQKVKDNTNELLDQWPDFPTLKDIIVIADRILSFSVTSPVSRYLTGLELLRDKIEEWNKNAHRANNMIEISLAVGQQIINWRKLEMSHWKECLNNLYQRKQSEAHKYWFFMYSVVELYLFGTEEGSDKGSVQAERVISVLRDFMEKSNLAEFDVRLDIVYAYHCHLVHLERSPRRDELLSILWNMYNYYSQFSSNVASYIKEKRAPIEKKLKDFVKICTWDRDLSYWNVKDTVEKAHKALHKHTKEFEKILKEPVTPCLVDNTTDVTDHVGIWDRPKRTTGGPTVTGGPYMIDPSNYVVLARNIKKYLDESEQLCPVIAETSLLYKVPNLLNKAKLLCKETISNSSYPSLVQQLDDFVTMVIETSTHLGSLDVEASASKEKQTSQAKNILQQKRKALADLFRYLTKMGLNYRSGLVILQCQAIEEMYDFTIAPVDVDAAMSYLKNRRCDGSLSLLWSGCEKYFQKNIVRHKRLNASLLQPHQDVGMQNIERCKGFAAQLLKITNTQKKSLSKYTRHLCDLRTITSSLTSALDLETDTNVTTMKQKVVMLTECYGNISLVLEQFTVLLKSFPEKVLSAVFEPQFDTVLSDSPIVRSYKNSEEWRMLYDKIKSLISSVNKQKIALSKLRNTMPRVIGKSIDLPLISQTHIDITNDAKDNLDKIKNELASLLEEYQFRFKSSTEESPKHPILRSIVSVYQYLEEALSRLTDLDVLEDESMEDTSHIQTELINQTEDVIATMLLIIQSIYKKHLPENKTDSDVLDAIDELIDDRPNERTEVQSKEILEDNHLKEYLQEKLTLDTKMLQIDALNTKLQHLFKSYVHFIAVSKDSDEVKNVVSRLVPILEQTILFVQYFITQKVSVHRVSCKMLSVLLKIFTDLTAKGFCKPSNIDMEDGDGEGGPGKMSSGTGLGEGEGQTDVSDRIENQDQLDDAHRPGEEKKEEERDCKEEEKGVNMTDDFDSHLQDVEKKEGEQDSDQDDDEDDADKQMGDTDNAAEKLDQQIWGSEDDEDIEEEQKEKKEEKGSGESTGEKEMGAKEEEQGTDDGSDGKDQKKKKDINQMDEPEVDDDHVDPYHGNQQPLPEPEDFDMPENMDLDGEEPGDDKEGDTETENPFEIDVMKDNIREEEEGKEEKEKNNEGLEVSSDEDDGGNDGDGEDTEKNDEQEKETDENQDDEDDGRDDEKDKTEEENAPEDGENGAEGMPETAKETPEMLEDNEPNKDEQKNPDKINEDDEVENKEHEANPQANPSNDQSSSENAENAQMEKGTNDNVEINADQAKDEDAAPFEQAQEQVGDDRQATGRSELDKSNKGHQGQKQAASRASSSEQQRRRNENKPGRTEHERTLGEVNEQKHKKTHTLNTEKEDEGNEEGGDNDDNNDKDADAYQHVKQAQKDDLQAVDAATKEQADQQPTLQQEDDEEADKLKEDEEVPMDVDDDDIQVEKAEKELTSEKTNNKTEKEQDKTGKKNEGGDEATGEVGVEVEGEAVDTATVPRGSETSYHTRLDSKEISASEMSVEEYMSIREWVQSRRQGDALSSVSSVGPWRSLWQETAGAARALCDALRLVLEPTARSRRAGDYRTGRAINMRRVIPYIASHFRKDRIWLRRTKPAKREYKIAIAVDDSSSMSDNRSKELAFESLALVSQALNLLESGDLAVLSFGEQPNLLHPFTEQFSEHSGAKILDKLRFEQTKTRIAQLLDFCTVLFEEQTMRSDAVNARLLVVVSDGRGIFSEGETKVIQAVRRARQQGIFLVYVIIDNPDNKDSIMDIRRPLFDPITNSLKEFVPYLDTFPFPFYLILRDMSALPTVLGDALRQWFELAANTAN